jgi:hypothetical protein
MAIVGIRTPRGRAGFGVGDRSMIFNTDLAKALEPDNILVASQCQPAFSDCAEGLRYDAFARGGRASLAQFPM